MNASESERAREWNGASQWAVERIFQVSGRSVSWADQSVAALMRYVYIIIYMVKYSTVNILTLYPQGRVICWAVRL